MALLGQRMFQRSRLSDLRNRKLSKKIARCRSVGTRIVRKVIRSAAVLLVRVTEVLAAIAPAAAGVLADVVSDVLVALLFLLLFPTLGI